MSARLIALIAALSFASLAARAAEETVKTFNIPSKPLAQALADFSRQSDVIIVAPSTLTVGKTSRPVNGAMSPARALEQLLGGTNLRYAMEKDGSVIVRPTPAQGAGALSALPAGTRLVLVDTDAAAAQPARSEEQQSRPVATDGQSSGELVVTGSRMRAVDRTAPVITIDRETIEKRGFSTVEDIVRSLPQNLASMNSARSVTQPVGGDGLPVGPAAQGEVTANLRGIGQSATLVLIDGRRTAGSAAFAGSAVNLSTIPAASIERVEILSDSAAAVYGSDAIAGVINIVLRKDYRGASSSLRYEDGGNGGSKASFDQVMGLGWNSGNLTATLTLADIDPVHSADIGYVTNDYRSLGGTDYRNTIIAQPGNVLGYGSLPLGYDGTEAWTLANLSQGNFQDARASLIPRDQTSERETRSLYVRADQSFGEGMDGFASLRLSRDKVRAVTQAPFVFGTVSAASPYNGTGQPLNVYYAAINEVEAGLLPLPRADNELRNLGVDAGIRFDLPVRDWRGDVSAMYSVSNGESSGMSYDFNTLRAAMGTEINPFGNGSAQNPPAFLSAYGPTTSVTDRETSLRGAIVSFDGSLAEFSTGSVRAAAGVEYRVEGVAYGARDYIASRDLADLSPSQSVTAVFAETRIPLPARVAATMQARWERYATDTSFGLIDGKTFQETSPRVGLVWNAVPGLALRGSWGHSFKAPNLANLVVVEQPGTVASNTFDPIENETVAAFRDSVPNPDLKPESGETITLGLDWMPAALQGLAVTLNFSRIRFDNRIVGSVVNQIGVLNVLSRPDVFPGVAVRDPVTNTLQRVRSFPFNVSSVDVDAIDFDLRYSFGEFTAGFQGTYALTHDRQVAPVLPVESLVGTTDADRFRSTVSAGWTRGGYGVDLFGNYASRYWNTEIQRVVAGSSPRRVQSYMTWDMTAWREFGGGWRVSAGARNLFDEPFPFHQGFAGPYDTRRVDLRGRLLHLEVRRDFSF